jgi:hypothetical protein
VPVTHWPKIFVLSQFTQLLYDEEEHVSADRGYGYPHIHANRQATWPKAELTSEENLGRDFSEWGAVINHAIVTQSSYEKALY